MNIFKVSLAVLALSAVTVYGTPQVNLGTADTFGVLGATTVTNTGLTSVGGNVGVSPGTAITGFPPGVLSVGAIDAGNAAAQQAHNDLGAAYSSASGAACGTSLTGQNLGGLTLTPGVYCFASSAQLTGGLTLNGQGNPNAVFIIQIGSTLTTASGSSVALIGGALGSEVFWQVGSSATLGTTSAFAGNILADTSITLNTGASLSCGGALALNGAVTLDTNNISACGAAPSNTPEPSAASFVLLAAPVLFWLRRARRPVRES